MSSWQNLAKPWVKDLSIYEPGKPIEEVARELGFDDAGGIVKLASNENALGPSPLAVRAMVAAASDMHLYPDGGAFYLRQALAKRLRVSPDEILVGNGSNEILELVGHVFLGPGTNIVVADRAFVVYRLVADAERAETVAVPMRAFTHDLEAMARAINERTRVVFIANPNNPTGTMVDKREIHAFMAGIPDHVIVIFDEAYIELLPEDRQPDVLCYVREGRKCMVLRTFSKTYGLAGLRIGYAVAGRDCIDLLHRVRQPFNVNTMAQIAALAALDDHEHVMRTRKMVADGLTCLNAGFRALGLEAVPSSANFVLVKVGKGREVFVAMQRERVIVRPMDGYGLPEYVRVTVGTQAENEQCLRALRNVLSRQG